MDYREFPAPPCLAPWIECIWTLRGHFPPASEHRVLPDGCFELILDSGDPMLQDGRPQPRYMVAGQMDRSLLLHGGGTVDTTGIRFHPEGARAFFRLPLHLLTNRVLELDAVLGSAQSRDLHRFAGLPPDRIFQHLARRLRDAPLPGPAIAAAVRYTVESAGAVTIDRLAERLGCTARHLNRSFREQVGIPPKVFARILRFQQVFAAWNTRNWPRLADLALECGFYDQAHLCHDFQQFSGLNPSEFFARPELLAHLFTRAHRMSDSYKPPA